MTLYLDNEPFAADGLAQDCTVGDVLQAARARVAGAGALIVSLQCDQNQVPAQRFTEVLKQPVTDFTRLDFFSGRAKPVVLEALRQIQTLFSETFAPLKTACEALAAGHVGEAMRTFADCVTVWGAAHETLVQGAGLLNVQLDTLEVAGRPMTDWLSGLASRLVEVKGAIETRDHVLLGDILRYEMDETLREWEQMLAGFLRHVEQLDESTIKLA